MPVITSSTSWGAKLAARAFSSEGMLGFAGCAMACASGSFALYMNMHGPLGGGEVSHYFTVFAQLSPHVPPRPAPLQAVPPPIGEDIDPVVTGSIRERGPNAPPRSSTTPANKPIIAHVILRQVDGDSALVEFDDMLVVYKIGDSIPGAGRLIAMTRQDGRPALETSQGLIVEAH